MNLRGKLFIKGSLPAVKYDKAYKDILTYVGSKYNHHVYKSFEYQGKTKGSSILKKPKAPMVKKSFRSLYLEKTAL